MNNSTSGKTAGRWVLLITNLPGRNPALRVRVWRALKAAGSGLLKDGVYVMPHSAAARRLFDEQAQDIRSGGGAGFVLSIVGPSAEQSTALRALFDRTEDYRTVSRGLEAFKHDIKRLAEAGARQRLATIRRDIAGLVDRDFFPGKPRGQIEAALEDAEANLNARFSPDEPHPAHRKIKLRNPAHYRKRIWATRERLWVDRVASAWLIRRFIDPDARFLWLKSIKDCPKRAVGFDFDHAEFTHVDSRVTFEVLVTSFGLERDTALSRIGSLVHYLDVGGIPIAEAAGLRSTLTGARVLYLQDDRLLEVMSPVLDSLYAAYSSE